MKKILARAAAVIAVIGAMVVITNQVAMTADRTIDVNNMWASVDNEDLTNAEISGFTVTQSSTPGLRILKRSDFGGPVFALEFPESAASTLDFTASAGEKVSVLFSSTSGTRTSEMAITNASGSVLAQKSVKGSQSKADTLEYTITSAGTYHIATTVGNRSAFVYKVVVSGGSSQPETQATTESTTQTTIETTTETTTQTTVQTTVETSTEATTQTVETSTEETTQNVTETGTEETTSSSGGSSFVYGDANCDGFVKSSDAAMVLQKVLLGATYKMDIENKTKNYLIYVDMDGNGELTAYDASQILQKVLNSSYKWPIEER